MSLNNDYTMQILAAEKVREFRAEAAQERLARIATGWRQPWWLRLFGSPVTRGQDSYLAAVKPAIRTPDTGNGLRIRAHHVAR